MNTNLKIGQRVELLPGREDVYRKVFPASPGVISGFREDQYGYPQVFIIWDKDHWRYNGEPDMWTFATHFRPIEGAEPELIGPEVHDIPSSPDTEVGIPTPEEDALMEGYMDTLIAAADKASESDAFFFICLKKDKDGRNGLEMLHAVADDRYQHISIADVFAFAEREMRRRGM